MRGVFENYFSPIFIKLSAHEVRAIVYKGFEIGLEISDLLFRPLNLSYYAE